MTAEQLQAALFGASVALMLMAALYWMSVASHEGAERRRRVAVARERSERARAGLSSIPDGNHGDNVSNEPAGLVAPAVVEAAVTCSPRIQPTPGRLDTFNPSPAIN